MAREAQTLFTGVTTDIQQSSSQKAGHLNITTSEIEWLARYGVWEARSSPPSSYPAI